VLPGDDLAWDPKCPPQKLRSWIRLKERNKITPTRRTVYFAAPPGIEPGLEFVKEWTRPVVKNTLANSLVEFPSTEEILDYLKAFYHGLPVKLLPAPQLTFTKDVEDGPPEKGKGRSKKVPKSPTLWLNTQTKAGAVGIRTRETPGGAFTHQLNLNDVLDAAMDILPDDAYALLMLLEHDIYEDEEDDFACGRAYGGSRIAVVSGARYNPILDHVQKIERDHAWPASHCEAYVRSCCEAAEEEQAGPPRKKTKTASSKSKISKMKAPKAIDDGPLYAALAAHIALPPLSHKPAPEALYGLWLGRVARTAGHELGHCFGIGHCTLYACSMLGTASIIEDARQPPYLCPVDLAKVLRATEADEAARDQAILEFCDRYQHTHLFAAFAAWIRRKAELSTLT
jgi:archaemetzincin